MSRSGRDGGGGGRVKNSKDNGLRRSSRQRRQIYDSLNQTILLEPHFDGLLFPDETRSGTRNLRSTNGRYKSSRVANRSSQSTPEEKQRRMSSDRVSSREVMALRDGGNGGDQGESDTEEILDIYSRVKRRRRCSQRAYVVEPHDDSNPSIVTEGDSDIVPVGQKRGGRQKRVANGIEPESSDSELLEEDTIRQRYFLRPQRQVTKRFEATLPEPKRRRLEQNAEHEDDGSEIHGSRSTAFQSPAHRRLERNRFVLSKKPSDSSSESDASDGELKFERKQAKKLERSRSRFLPFNLNAKDVQRSLGKIAGRPRHGASCADVDPMHIDNSIGFESIGGLTHHIYSLKEMILFPMMYPEIFAKFKISPPRGVLFYGPPGTGKTLVARALANECSKSDKKVAFFMRKGADCLSKWVGESERQLRLLFDQAYSMRPSIIFFDEIDGLAPVRSSRQDQIHSSIVSTLLALMDGLDERGEVVIIGATNRLDSIDPALRRPGRFDRELRFTMPDKEARKQILRIHTKAWEPPLDDNLVVRLAERAVGYGGADLKGLCTEAALIALRKTYPQIYAREERLALDPRVIKVKEDDFVQAMEKQAPSSERSLTAPVRAVSDFMQPLIGSKLKKAIELVPKEFVKCETEEKRDIFDVKSVLSSLAKRPPMLGRRILLCGESSDNGQTKYFAPALLHFVDHLPVYSLAIPNMYSSTSRTPEEFIAETLTMAARCGPCVLYLPGIDTWNNVVSPTAWATLKTCLDNWTAKTPVLILATAHSSVDELDADILSLFAESGILRIDAAYSDKRRRAFFEPLLIVEAQRALDDGKEVIYEELAIAPPPPPRKFTEVELKELRRQEESILRELRIFLREIALRLFRDRKFSLFAKPVDLEQAPDYYEIVEHPMDLSMIMSKIDQHKYESVNEFLADIDLIRQNALEYNPDHDQTDKIIRHRACNLRDVAYALIDTELDWQFEERCKEIQAARRKRNESGPAEAPPDYVFTTKSRLITVNDKNKDETSGRGRGGERDGIYVVNKVNSATKSATAGKVKAAAIVKKYKNATRRNLFHLKVGPRNRSIKKHKKTNLDDSMVVIEEIVDADADAEQVEGNEVKNNDGDNRVEDSVELPEPPKVEIDIDDLNKLLDDVVETSRDYSLVALERMYVEIEAVVARYAKTWDRKGLVREIRSVLRM